MYIHKALEKLSEHVYNELCLPKEDIDTDELYKVIDMIKDLSEAEYKAHISYSMREAEKHGEAAEIHSIHDVMSDDMNIEDMLESAEKYIETNKHSMSAEEKNMMRQRLYKIMSNVVS